MASIMMIPRSVYFKNNIAIGTFAIGDYDSMKVICLPTDHFDFVGPISVFGKTEQEIRLEVLKYSATES